MRKISLFLMSLLLTVGAMAQTPIKHDAFEPGKNYRVYNQKSGESIKAWVPNAGSTKGALADYNADDNAQIWKFISTDNGKYLIYNVATKKYLQNVGGDSGVSLTADENQAAGYTMRQHETDNTKFAFYRGDNSATQAHYLYNDGGNKLYGWTNNADEWWSLELCEEAEIVSVTFDIYDGDVKIKSEVAYLQKGSKITLENLSAIEYYRYDSFGNEGEITATEGAVYRVNCTPEFPFDIATIDENGNINGSWYKLKQSNNTIAYTYNGGYDNGRDTGSDDDTNRVDFVTDGNNAKAYWAFVRVAGTANRFKIYNMGRPGVPMTVIKHKTQTNSNNYNWGMLYVDIDSKYNSITEFLITRNGDKFNIQIPGELINNNNATAGDHINGHFGFWSGTGTAPLTSGQSQLYVEKVSISDLELAKSNAKAGFNDALWGEGFPNTSITYNGATISSWDTLDQMIDAATTVEEVSSRVTTLKENVITYKIRMYNAGRYKQHNQKWYVSGNTVVENGNENSLFVYNPVDRTLKQIATGKYLVSGNTHRGQYQEMVSDANNASKFKFTQSDRIDGAWSVYDSYGYMCDWGWTNILFSLEASTDNWATWTVEAETITPEVPEVPVEFSYETLDKPAFALAGGTTKVGMIELDGVNLTGFTYTQGNTERFDMPEVEAGKTYSLDLTYEMHWGNLAIYQIDKDSNEKKYGYYTCLWEADAKPIDILARDNSDFMCKELGISSLDELEAMSAGENTYLTIPYKITIDENLEAGDIVVVRVMVAKNEASGEYEYNTKDYAEGGCLDLVFTVKEPEVVPVELAAGKYFRLKGKNGEYLTNDGTGYPYKTTLQTKPEADINSIFYIEQGNAENMFYILSYENGHYVANPYRIGVGEEAINENEIYKQQWEITGSNGVYTFKYGIEYGSGHYMTNPSTGVTGWSDNVNESAWTLEEVTELPVTISAAGWATFYAPVEVKKPEGVKAYYLLSDGVKSGYVKMEEITIGIIPANSAVILEGEAKEHSFEITNNGYPAIIDNLFQGTVAAEYILGEAYVLGYINVAEEGQPENKEVGLYKTTLNKLNNSAFLNNGHKVYLPANAVPTNVALSANLRFDFGGITTAIEEVETEAAETVIYDLTGRRVNEITKAGVYVVNGRKVLVK